MTISEQGPGWILEARTVLWRLLHRQSSVRPGMPAAYPEVEELDRRHATTPSERAHLSWEAGTLKAGLPHPAVVQLVRYDSPRCSADSPAEVGSAGAGMLQCTSSFPFKHIYNLNHLVAPVLKVCSMSLQFELECAV